MLFFLFEKKNFFLFGKRTNGFEKKREQKKKLLRMATKKTKEGKLCANAELFFSYAYGLRNCRKIDHYALIPMLMTLCNCSFRAVASLFYGLSYKEKLHSLRMEIPNYFANQNLKIESLNDLPPLARFDANSVLLNVEQQPSCDTNENDAMLQFLDKCACFQFATRRALNDHTQIQLAAVIDMFTMHQRAWLAPQIACCLNDILQITNIHFAGPILFDEKEQIPVIGRGLLQTSASISRCAFVSGIRRLFLTEKPEQNVVDYLCARITRIKNASAKPSVLNPFLTFAQSLPLALLNASKNTLCAPNLTPENIYVEFEHSMPFITTINGWDSAEIVPHEIARCFVPGWLWIWDFKNRIAQYPNGYSLFEKCDDMCNEHIRLSFIDKMEQLCPGYFTETCTYQRLNIGILGRIARKGLNFSDQKDVIFYENALQLLNKEEQLQFYSSPQDAHTEKSFSRRQRRRRGVFHKRKSH